MKNNSTNLGLAIVLILSGCGGVSTDYHKLDLATVSGTVKLDGQPLADAHIMYQDKGGTFSVGTTDESGHYEMMFDSNKAGVLTGEKLVRIRLTRGWNGFPTHPLTDDVTEEVGEDAAGEADDGSSLENEPVSQDPNELPITYHLESKLKVTIESGDHTIDFDLKSDGSTTGPAS